MHQNITRTLELVYLLQRHVPVFQDPSLWRHALSMASESNDTPLNRGPTQVALSSANRVASAEAVV